MPFTSFALAFLAGILTVLSPCVLPILPIVFASAASKNRAGPAALALGVAFAFSAAGLFFATVGYSLRLDNEALRPVFGAVLIALALIMLVPRLQRAVAAGLAPIANWASQNSRGVSQSGSLGQFGLGAMMGLVWSPCVGPTLGAASALASQGRDLPAVATVMLLFGLGAALPLLGIGLLSRAALMRMRGALLRGGLWGRWLMATAMLVIGMAIVTGFDRIAETALLNMSPRWLTNLTTGI